MKLKAFNKQLKKEFNENYNEKALVEIKEKKKKSIWIRLIPAYAILGILLIFGIVLGIDQLAVNDYNNRYYHLSDAYQNASYVELNKISEKEFKELKDFTPRQSILDKIKGINFNIFSAGASAPVTEEVSAPDKSIIPSTDTSYDTNNQERNVIEADIAKFDGKYCYYVYDSSLVIYDLDGNMLVKEYLEFEIGVSWTLFGLKLQIYKDLIIVYNDTALYILRFNEENHTLKEEAFIYHSIETRIFENQLFVISYHSSNEELDFNNLYYDGLSSRNNIYCITKYDLDTLEMNEVEVLGNYKTVCYMSDEYISLSNYEFYQPLQSNKTLTSVFTLNLEPVGVFVAEGTVLNQYSVDIYKNELRVVSTSIRETETNILTIFDLKELKVLSVLDQGIGLYRERVKSVSFTDTTCYVVTYRQTDPLYEIDLTDPKNPIIKDAIHVDGYSSYLKTFSIAGVEYVFGAGVINRNCKYSIYKNDDENTQIGKDYYVSGKDVVENIYGVDYIYNNSASSSCINPHAMFFYVKDDILYFGAPVNRQEYTLYKIDVNAEEVISVYKSFDTTRETRLFLFEGNVYLPQEDKLIKEAF
ncbi:MAG: beta-propeller domain-containing protein [Acholeplasmatales bacterium]|nr:beta-propeller domain-containing protein [Acholeplasmatales bacterium]